MLRSRLGHKQQRLCQAFWNRRTDQLLIQSLIVLLGVGNPMQWKVLIDVDEAEDDWLEEATAAEAPRQKAGRSGSRRSQRTD